MTHLVSISTYRKDGAQLVALGAQFAIPQRFVATITPDDPTTPICHLDIAVTDGRPACRALTLELGNSDQQIDGKALRSVPLATYVKRAVDAEAMSVFCAPDPAAPMFIQVPGEERQRLRSEPFGAEHVAVRLTGASHTAEVKALLRAPRAVVTDATLLEVADVYRSAHARREPPTKAVMGEWHVSRSTASRWIKRARNAGHLGPARPRMAGERAVTENES